MNYKVGIPRALLFYEYSPLWIHFFENLGAEVIISKKTSKTTVKNGTNHAVDDVCIPVKVYHGHVIDLIDQVDYLFIPRIMGVSKGDFICPKFCGLPEMIKYSIKNLPVLINTKIDLTKSSKQLPQTIYEIGSYITDDHQKISKSYYDAWDQYVEYKNNFKKGILPIQLYQASHDTKQPKIMVMGHPYVLYDDYLNMNLIQKLHQNGFRVITPEMIDDDVINQFSKQYHGKIYWRFSRALIGTCLYLAEQKLVDGVVFISSFGCGIDSIVSETVERRVRRETDIPFMLLTIDEHTGEAGFNTRLEAYTDMLKWRLNHEHNIPAHG